jgi:hypothetical protein
MSNQLRSIYIGLVHHPVRNKKGDIVTTSVTNLDIHDIARTTQTYAFRKYFIITPIKAQQSLVHEITDHWKTDFANEYNPDRQNALSHVHVMESIEDSIKEIEKIEGVKPLVAVTGANFDSFDGDEKTLAHKIKLDKVPLLLLFGTGWGLTALVVENSDFKLGPIFGKTTTWPNHLSVRSAVAIYSDRLNQQLINQ